MRKIISLGLFALMLSIFSSQVFAGKVPVCEQKKDELKSKGLYGLCNAYWNADNENVRDQILAKFVKKAGRSLDGPGMPGLEPDEPDVPDQGLTCPCWDFDTLVQVVACSSLLRVEYQPDLTEDQSSFDYAAFQNSAGDFVVLMAGFNPFDIQTPDDAKECLFDTSIGQISMGEGKVPFKATSDIEDLACRLDVLDLIAEPPLSSECNP